jgi:hypothetical protein
MRAGVLGLVSPVDEDDMRIQNVVWRPFALMVIPCPDCGRPMRLAAVTPVETAARANEIQEITYRCDACDCDLKRVSRSKD